MIDPIECRPLDLSFDHFWSNYPRKQDKKRSMKLFDQLSDVDKWNAIQGVKHHASSNPQWRNPAFVPMPSTYLNQRRWEDEIAEEKDAKARVVGRNDSPAHIVWSAMTQMYGDQWIKKHGEEPSELWRKLLKDMPEEQIKKGLRATFDQGSEFPPSLPKFAEYCKGAPALPESRMLPKPPGDPEKALEAIEEMKRILGVE